MNFVRTSPVWNGLKIAFLATIIWSFILSFLVAYIDAKTLYLVPLIQTGWILVSLLGGYGSGFKARTSGWLYGGLTGVVVGLFCGLLVLFLVPGWVSFAVFISMNLVSVILGAMGGSAGINHRYYLRERNLTSL